LKAASAPEPSGNGEKLIYPKCVWLFTVLLKKVTWAVGSSLLCSQYTSGWTRPWAPPKKILDPPMIMIFTEYIFRLLSINHLQLLFKRP